MGKYNAFTHTLLPTLNSSTPIMATEHEQKPMKFVAVKWINRFQWKRSICREWLLVYYHHPSVLLLFSMTNYAKQQTMHACVHWHQNIGVPLDLSSFKAISKFHSGIYQSNFQYRPFNVASIIHHISSNSNHFARRVFFSTSFFLLKMKRKTKDEEKDQQ